MFVIERNRSHVNVQFITLSSKLTSIEHNLALAHLLAFGACKSLYSKIFHGQKD